MILDRDNIISYLVSNGFNSCKIVQIRNLRNFCAIINTDKGKIVVKQEGHFTTKFSLISLESELQFYRNKKKDLNSITPKVFLVDDANSIVIIEFLEEYQMSVNYDDSNFSQSENIGRSLALVHNSSCLNQKVSTQIFFRFFDIITPEAYNAGGRLFEKCIELMQRFPDLNESLRAFEQEFVWDCFIHGDLKNDNFLLFENNVKFIDWELSGLGDRYLDLGFIIGNYILFWIEKMSFDKEKEIQNEKHLEQIKEHIFLFLSNYKTHVKNVDFQFNYDKIVKFAGVFLLNVFYSKSVFKSEYSKQDIMVLEYGRKMLVFSSRFTIELFIKNIIEQNARTIE